MEKHYKGFWNRESTALLLLEVSLKANLAKLS